MDRAFAAILSTEHMSVFRTRVQIATHLETISLVCLQTERRNLQTDRSLQIGRHSLQTAIMRSQSADWKPSLQIASAVCRLRQSADSA